MDTYRHSLLSSFGVSSGTIVGVCKEIVSVIYRSGSHLFLIGLLLKSH